MHALFFEEVLIILGQHTKHANSWLGVQYPLNLTESGGEYLCLLILEKFTPPGGKHKVSLFAFMHKFMLPLFNN